MRELGLDRDEDGPGIDRAASLLPQLPAESRLARREHPDLAWGPEAMFLRLVEYEMRGILYSLGGAKGEKPQPIGLPSEQLKKEQMLEQAEQAREEVDEILKGYLPKRDR